MNRSSLAIIVFTLMIGMASGAAAEADRKGESRSQLLHQQSNLASKRGELQRMIAPLNDILRRATEAIARSSQSDSARSVADEIKRTQEFLGALESEQDENRASALRDRFNSDYPLSLGSPISIRALISNLRSEWRRQIIPPPTTESAMQIYTRVESLLQNLDDRLQSSPRSGPYQELNRLSSDFDALGRVLN